MSIYYQNKIPERTVFRSLLFRLKYNVKCRILKSQTLRALLVVIECWLSLFPEVFKYHMVPGRRTSHMLRDGEKLYTLHGYPVDISINAAGTVSTHFSLLEILYSNVTAVDLLFNICEHKLFEVL